MSKPTQGPWFAKTTTTRADQARVIAAKNEAGFTPWVCHIQTVDIDVGNANARLIAAAPDLLEALNTAKWMLERDYIDDQKMAVIRKCENAITKANGGES